VGLNQTHLTNKGASASFKKESIVVLCTRTYLAVIIAVVMNITAVANANPVKDALSILAQNCVDCHGGLEVNADVNLKSLRNARHLRNDPGMIVRVMNAVSDKTMPPEGVAVLDEDTRSQLLQSLGEVLRQIEFENVVMADGVARLNRFQYNNTIKDLFDLKNDVFTLPEKLMTRHDPYLTSDVGMMPERVRVESLTLRPLDGMRGVKSFPKDSRASHGFDNQVDILTMSPLLLDAFFRLSVSIVESPDFNQQNIGIWDQLFTEQQKGEILEEDIRKRLEVFLYRAFRRPIDQPTLERYTNYALSHTSRGLGLTATMKKVVAAVLSSPRFFYRSRSGISGERQFEVAASLSYTLWGSCPDAQLLELASAGRLGDPDVLRSTIARMLKDPKIERFMDSFPVQWMQLETLMAVTPDPSINRYFSLDGQYPATVQMVLEPLLLFDGLFVENRPLGEFIAPTFSYHSPFLTSWYTDKLEPPPVDEVAINQENDKRNKAIAAEQVIVDGFNKQLQEVEKTIRDPVAGGLVKVNLEDGQRKWEETQNQPVKTDFELSPWSKIGPFRAAGLDAAHNTAFVDEAAVDLEKQYGELRWELSNELVDGKIHQLREGNSAHYLFRTVKTDVARSIEVSLGSDDSFKLWHNGVLIGERNMVRGVAADQDKFRLQLSPGENTILFKISNEVGGYAFYFKATEVELPEAVVAALLVERDARNEEQLKVLSQYYLAIAAELREIRRELNLRKNELTRQRQETQDRLNLLPKPKSVAVHRQEIQNGFDNRLRNQLRSQEFKRVAIEDQRYGGIITNAAMLSMTSGPKRTHPVARGVWITEVIFNDPPSPPPNDIPPLNEEDGPKDLTIREKFAAHRENPSCAGCHSKLDPLGFALENYDITGRWRERYPNGREVDVTGTLMRTHEFDNILEFKRSLTTESERFSRAFVSHLFRFAVARELTPQDEIIIDKVIARTRNDGHRLKAIIEEVAFLSVQ